MLTIENIRDKTYHERVAREDYMTAGGEPPGVWYNGEVIGRLSGELIKKGELPRVLDGKNADGEDLLSKRIRKNHRPGLDLTFAAPKSVSVLWGVSDEETRRKISKAMYESVAETMDFLSENAARARRGKGGNHHEEVKFVAGLYEHCSARDAEGNIDPHLHFHAVVANLAKRADETYGGLEFAYVMDWQKAGGAVFRAQFAHKLADMGYGIEQDERKEGWGFRIRGVPDSIEEMFSGRNQQILKEMEEAGLGSYLASDLAQKKTRAYKEEDLLRSELWDKWSERARSAGFEYILENHQGSERVLEDVTQDHFEGLTENEAVIRIQDVFAATADFGVGVWNLKNGVRNLVEKFKSSNVFLKRHIRNEMWTTVGMRASEKRMVQTAIAMKDMGGYELLKRAATIFFDGKRLTEDQIRTFDYVVSSGRIKLVVGWAGTGKSFTMGAVREAYEGEGYRVLGAAFSGKAADELQKGSGIDSATLDSRLASLSFERLQLDDRTVLVVDEAGMAGTRHVDAILRHAAKAGSKVVLLGDPKQIKPIAAGGAFELLKEMVGSVELEEVFRQKEPWFMKAVKSIGADKISVVEDGMKVITEGGVVAGMKALKDHGMIKVAEKVSESRKDLVDDWWNDRKEFLSVGKAVSDDHSLMVAYLRKDVDELNRIARKKMQETGALGESIQVEMERPVASVGRGPSLKPLSRASKENPTEKIEREFAVGDIVLMLKNDYKIGVKNGQLWKLSGIRQGESGTEFELSKGKEKKLISLDQYRFMDHGYAVTVHKSQGVTFNTVYAYIMELYDRNSLYVATSRARFSSFLHYATDTVKAVVDMMKKDRKEMSLTTDDEEKIFHEKIGKSSPKKTTHQFKKIDHKIEFEKRSQIIQ